MESQLGMRLFIVIVMMEIVSLVSNPLMSDAFQESLSEKEKTESHSDCCIQNNLVDSNGIQQISSLAKNYNETIELHRARIKKGGSKESVWLSTCMIAECYDKMEQWDQALHWHLQAFS